MSSQVEKLPKEQALFDLLNGVPDIKTQCVGCREIKHKIVKEYITDLATRGKLVVACSEHVIFVIQIIWTFQEYSKWSNTIVELDNVTPKVESDTTNRIYNFGMSVAGKTVRVLLATDKVINSTELPEDIRLATQGTVESATAPGAESSTHSDPDRVILRLSELSDSLATTTSAQLSGPDRTLLFASGLAQIEVAREALENAFVKLRIAMAGDIGGDAKGVKQRAAKLKGSVNAIAKLAQKKSAKAEEGKAQEMGEEKKWCNEPGNFVNDEAMPYIQAIIEDVLEPDEEARIEDISEWLHTL